MKKATKILLIAGAVDIFYGHYYAIWRNVSPETFDRFFEVKDNFYGMIGLDKLWNKKG